MKLCGVKYSILSNHTDLFAGEMTNCPGPARKAEIADNLPTMFACTVGESATSKLSYAARNVCTCVPGAPCQSPDRRFICSRPKSNEMIVHVNFGMRIDKYKGMGQIKCFSLNGGRSVQVGYCILILIVVLGHKHNDKNSGSRKREFSVSNCSHNNNYTTEITDANPRATFVCSGFSPAYNVSWKFELADSSVQETRIIGSCDNAWSTCHLGTYKGYSISRVSGTQIKLVINAVINHVNGKLTCVIKVPGEESTSRSCSITVTSVDECESGPCRNGGTCVDHRGWYSCSCLAGFGGKSCELELLLHTCVNDTTEVPDGARNATVVCSGFLQAYNVSWTIEVASGSIKRTWTIGSCGAFPRSCEFGKKIGYRITRPSATTSVLIINAVENAEFVQNGTLTCVIKTDAVDECASDPCRYNGTCVDTLGAFSCICQPEFRGDLCETGVIDYCASDPCQNGGNCTNYPDHYICNCTAGFWGDNCDR
ncbi:hypothetical protein BaRGS_00031396, partial [Batillaria attramentaria]